MKFIRRILLGIFIKKDIKSGRIEEKDQKQLSKEFVRRWLIENGFQGKEGQTIPDMTEAYIESVSERYIELYENILEKSLSRLTFPISTRE